MPQPRQTAARIKWSIKNHRMGDLPTLDRDQILLPTDDECKIIMSGARAQGATTPEERLRIVWREAVDHAIKAVAHRVMVDRAALDKRPNPQKQTVTLAVEIQALIDARGGICPRVGPQAVAPRAGIWQAEEKVVGIDAETMRQLTGAAGAFAPSEHRQIREHAKDAGLILDPPYRLYSIKGSTRPHQLWRISENKLRELTQLAEDQKFE